MSKIHIKATHKEYGMMFGTLEVIELLDDIVFVLNMDSAPFYDTPDNFCLTIKQPTLSELTTSARLRGLSDIEPLHELSDSTIGPLSHDGIEGLDDNNPWSGGF